MPKVPSATCGRAAAATTSRPRRRAAAKTAAPAPPARSRHQAAAPGGATPTPTPAFDAGQVRLMVAEAVAEAVREAMQAVAAPPPATVAPAAISPPDSAQQPTTALAVISPPGSSRQATSAGYNAPELSAAPSTSMPGTCASPHTTESVTSSVRQRIITDRYLAMGLLLDSADRAQDDGAPSFQVIDGLLRPAARAPRPVNSFGAWCLAFLRFAGIYLEAHPDAAAGLMAHMRQVGSLTSPGLGFAWRDFDEAFRKARETAPGLHPWGQTASASPLWLQSVATGIGGAARPQSGASRPGAQDRFRPCFAFNMQRGCSAQSCRYTHACRACRGSHPAFRCTARNARNRANVPALPAPSTSSR